MKKAAIAALMLPLLLAASLCTPLAFAQPSKFAVLWSRDFEWGWISDVYAFGDGMIFYDLKPVGNFLRIKVLNASTGALLRSLMVAVDPDDLYEKVTQLVYKDGKLFIHSRYYNYTYCVNASTGEILWKINKTEIIEGTVNCYFSDGIAINGSRIYGGIGIYAFCFDMEANATVWYADAEGDVRGIPIIYKDLVIFTTGGAIKVINAYCKDGLLKWSTSYNGDLLCPILMGDQLIVCNDDDPAEIYSYQAETGGLLWTWQNSSLEISAFFQFYNRIYIVCCRQDEPLKDYRITCLDPEGVPLWHKCYPPPESVSSGKYRICGMASLQGEVVVFEYYHDDPSLHTGITAFTIDSSNGAIKERIFWLRGTSQWSSFHARAFSNIDGDRFISYILFSPLAGHQLQLMGVANPSVQVIPERSIIAGEPGSPLSLKVTILNHGNYEDAFNVTLLLEGEVLCENTSFIGISSSAEMVFNFTAPEECGEHLLQVKVYSPKLKEYVAECNVTLTVVKSILIALKAGWNFISLPLKPVNGSVELAERLHAYGWDSRLMRYVGVDKLEFGRGYWVYTSADTLLTVTGVEVECCRLDLVEGWNLVGGLSSEAVVPSVRWIYPYVYTMIPGVDHYVSSQVLLPGHAHWLLALRNGTISLIAS